jgi:transposase
MQRKAYPGDVTDEEWALVAPCLTLMAEGAPQRTHSLREVFNGPRRIVRAGATRRVTPHDLPPREVVYRQAQRWPRAGVSASLAHDLRELLRAAAGRDALPSAAVSDGRAPRSGPESGARAGYDGAKRRKGGKAHTAVDTPGRLPALTATPASEQDRAQVKESAAAVQEVTGGSVGPAFVDQGYTGEAAAESAAAHGMRSGVVKPPEAKRGLVSPPRRRAVERSFARAARSRRSARDYERLPETPAGPHLPAFAILMLERLVEALAQSS